MGSLYLRQIFVFFFFNDTATTEIYTLSLHDALPISSGEEPVDTNSTIMWFAPEGYTATTESRRSGNT